MNDMSKLNEVAETTKTKGKLTLTLEASQRLPRHLYMRKRDSKQKQIFFERRTALGWLRLEVDLWLEVGIVTLEDERMNVQRSLPPPPPSNARRSRDPNPRERQELLAKIRREQGDPELAYHRGYRSC